MRWALFPAMAAVACAAGSTLAIGWGWGWDFAIRHLAIAAGLGTAAAFAAVSTPRTWLALLAAPACGLLAVAGASVLSAAYGPGTMTALPSPWKAMRILLNQSSTTALIAGTCFLQTLAHRLSFTRPWPATMGVWGIATLLVAALAGLLGNPWERTVVSIYLAGCTLAQAAAVLAARTVARRLRPPEAA